MYDYFRKWSDSDLANYYVDVSASVSYTHLTLPTT